MNTEGVPSLQREYRLKRRNDFRRIFREGQSFANRQFVVISLLREKAGPPRIGISVSKKVGNAVVRNRIKRRIKEVNRQWIHHIRLQTDMVIVARNSVTHLDYQQIKSSLHHLLSRAKLFTKEVPPRVVGKKE
jgi:ribonuclease P protein component